jgi:hypothetical protein
MRVFGRKITSSASEAGANDILLQRHLPSKAAR